LWCLGQVDLLYSWQANVNVTLKLFMGKECDAGMLLIRQTPLSTSEYRKCTPRINDFTFNPNVSKNTLNVGHLRLVRKEWSNVLEKCTLVWKIWIHSRWTFSISWNKAPTALIHWCYIKFLTFFIRKTKEKMKTSTVW
jgi:hypothetical protein